MQVSYKKAMRSDKFAVLTLPDSGGLLNSRTVEIETEKD